MARPKKAPDGEVGAQEHDELRAAARTALYKQLTSSARLGGSADAEWQRQIALCIRELGLF